MLNVKLKYSEFESNIFKIVDKYYFTKYEKLYGVAVSGGPDSMLLLYVLSKWAYKKNKSLYVFSFDHNLRQESAYELTLVEKFCKKLNCNFTKIKWDKKPKTAIMEQARIARYSYIAEKCNQNNIKTLFLGHHADDIAETVSMRIFNNSNLEGLCPIFELREIFNIKLFRPFLSISKDQILDLNLAEKINYVDDVSNINEKFFRSRIRKLLNQDKQLKNNLIKASSLFCKIRKFNDDFIKKHFNNYYYFKNEGFFEIKREIIKKFPKFLIICFFKMVIFRLGNKDYFSKNPIPDDIYLKVMQYENVVYSLGGCIIVFNKKKIYICREYKDIEKKLELVDVDKKIIWDNRFEIKNNTRNQIKILPLGKVLNNSFYQKKFKIYKKMIKNLPFRVRKTIPAIFTLEGFIHIPHLNISEINTISDNIECRTIDFFHKKYDNIK
ncbi:MAG: tRNA lysidine(34) synthetase TilS [Alphaproteobacteria bacterium TMED62]|nr:MAG: tRNA lysidine(34) synthetase TilS [Alphaproteobacteria bacterium TMED62]